MFLTNKTLLNFMTTQCLKYRCSFCWAGYLWARTFTTVFQMRTRKLKDWLAAWGVMVKAQALEPDQAI